MRQSLEKNQVVFLLEGVFGENLYVQCLNEQGPLRVCNYYFFKQVVRIQEAAEVPEELPFWPLAISLQA